MECGLELPHSKREQGTSTNTDYYVFLTFGVSGTYVREAAAGSSVLFCTYT